ncbi:glycosyltransferase family 4 protein [Phenylobacterium sp.]|uniref:glycosyltransferase family 4 protein n=1 Tax=Phenylobacterium sp. TaxID=1871053 RepID=UPI0025D3D5D1|nr:glycosyltransferase family 4 protein [Phenylobacterium sp.]
MVSLLLLAPVCNGDDVGEAWVAYQWAKHLGERHDVTLLTYHRRGARPAADQLPGLRVIEWIEPPLVGRAERLNAMLKPGYVPYYIKARRWIREAISRGEHFDVAHQVVPVAMRYPSPALGFGIPLVMGPVGGGLSSPPGLAADEGSTPWYMNLRRFDRARMRLDPLLRRTYEQADCVLGIAEYVRDLLEGLDLRRFEVMSETGLDSIPDPVDRTGRKGTVRLLYVGRLIRTKGARDILRAMPQLADLDLHLDIVGEGPERAACAALIAELGLTARVTLHGWKSKEEVARFYRDADVFVFPSYREPGGNVALEAMGYGLPLIVVDRGGPGSATNDDCAIRLRAVTPDLLSQDVADAIRKLTVDPDLRQVMGLAARRHVGATALWGAKIDRIDAIYRDLIAASDRTVPTGAPRP